MPEQSESNDKISIDSGGVIGNVTVFRDLSREILMIDKNKVKLCLLDNKEKLRAQQRWKGYGGMLITLIVALITNSRFRPFFIWSSTIWRTLFIVAALLVMVKMVNSYRRSSEEGGVKSVDEIIGKLKEDAEKVIVPK